ncbi:TPA: hypothetical protein DIU27_01565 [Candidatus Collierbacteria bacterium]|uniref:Uncharacterized protein n=1 Tax=Candidatus Collierbacteria bacterium GW2011_GWB2_44_22 TaxID=1618387 RepID=A0A0G1HXX3_9BACT|nr:MAG: hypothetical protein UW31_C0021G0001 [Candidatus Collierbacteria bacterium GW2011_GWA2_44_13]KKT51790.1 MAG: hypothetical protein UW44_C0008G0112 [Candidatus Collierbacteria bacterium GW2011_GWB2_44_22]KKT61915.1 MAG: hypothetical protein UW56_C0015G0009 [Candidatus Collierbacteria bacterium GW2011_GWD1_44_27]KKT65797.1 MAG: hypothetical protein UW58_C0019G0017 [Candidatus Collierbacteria bacterium GW2011_GWC2_44_30]KKT68467.1 MAG: hypothetical protein UW64_C0018G0015 [Microgenomates gr
MKKFDRFLNSVLKVILIFLIILGGFGVYWLFRESLKSAQPRIPGSEDNQRVLNASTTQMSEAGNPIPEQEYLYLYVRDISGLQAYLDTQAKNWLNLSLNIHSRDISGVATSSEKVESVPCGWGNTAGDLLCRYALIEYTAVYKGVLTGGTQAEFILHPVVTLGDDWTETSRTPKGDKIEITYIATATVTFSGQMCITSVEENTPSSILDGETPPSDDSYTIKSLDERRLWPDLGPWIFPTGINEEYLRLDAYKKAKTIALWPKNIEDLYSLIELDMRSGGSFYEAIKSFYTPELAKMYNVKDFIVVMSPTRGDSRVRCDGSNVNK